MTDCIFCKIIAREMPAAILYEDEDFTIFLDAFPTTRGHSLIVPKKHFSRFDQTPIEVVEKMIGVVQRIAPRIVRALSAQAFNLILNNGLEAGQVIPHTHWHIIPRYADDGLRHWPPKEGGSGEISEVAKILADNFRERPIV